MSATIRKGLALASSMSGVITDIIGRMILDSRGNPTIEVDCYVDGVLRGRAGVPSGASTGSHEAVELRDGGPIWAGKGVDTAVANTNGAIRNFIALGRQRRRNNRRRRRNRYRKRGLLEHRRKSDNRG